MGSLDSRRSSSLSQSRACLKRCGKRSRLHHDLLNRTLRSETNERAIDLGGGSLKVMKVKDAYRVDLWDLLDGYKDHSKCKKKSKAD